MKVNNMNFRIQPDQNMRENLILVHFVGREWSLVNSCAKQGLCDLRRNLIFELIEALHE